MSAVPPPAAPSGQRVLSLAQARFTLSDLPGLTSWPPHRAAGIAAVAAALAALGRGYLGGHLEVTSRGPAADAAERLAARRAVESAVRGGCGTARAAVTVRPPLPSGAAGRPRTLRRTRTLRPRAREA